MKIEEGKFYRAANGSKVGPMMHMGRNFCEVVGDNRAWTVDGEGVNQAYGLDLIAEWTDGSVFTVGAKVRRISYPHSFVPIGYEATITDVSGDSLSYVDADGDPMSSSVEYWELVFDAPTGPVRTVRWCRGVWSRVRVTGSLSDCVEVGFDNHINGTAVLTSDELRAAAAVLLELAGALEE